MAASATDTTPASLKAEGGVLAPINESPTLTEGHDTVTDDRPTNSPSAEGHAGTFARFFLLVLEPLLNCSTVPQPATVGGHSSREDDVALLARFVQCTSVVYPCLSVVGSSQVHLMRALRS